MFIQLEDNHNDWYWVATNTVGDSFIRDQVWLYVSDPDSKYVIVALKADQFRDMQLKQALLTYVDYVIKNWEQFRAAFEGEPILIERRELRG